MGITQIKETISTLDIGLLHITNLDCTFWGDPVLTTSFDFLWWEVNGYWKKSLIGFSKEKCIYGYYTETTFNFLGFKYVLLKRREDEDSDL